MIKSSSLAIVIALFAMPISYSQANDSKPNISYSAKKAGKVAFSENVDDQRNSEKANEENINPENIEPSAGANDEDAPQEKDDLAKSIKLPRK